MQMGNALTDDHNDHRGLFQFMWAAGLISDQTYKKSVELCDKESFVSPSRECDQITDIAYEEMGNIDPYSIFTPPCTAYGLTNRLLRRWHVSISFLKCVTIKAIYGNFGFLLMIL